MSGGFGMVFLFLREANLNLRWAKTEQRLKTSQVMKLEGLQIPAYFKEVLQNPQSG